MNLRTIYCILLCCCAFLPACAATKYQDSGTAFVVNPDGYLVTCAHVVEGARAIAVLLGDNTYNATLVTSRADLDLAILKIGAHNLPALALGDSDAVEQGADIRAFGFPLSDLLGHDLKVTRGSISGVTTIDATKLFQIDAPVNGGNSGGPIVNDHAEAVGVVNAKLNAEKYSDVGFAIPVNQVKALLDAQKIRATGSKSGDKLDGPALVKAVAGSLALVRVSAAGAAPPSAPVVTHPGTLRAGIVAVVNVGAHLAKCGQVGGKWGVIDNTGKYILPPTFDMIEDYSGGLAAVGVGTQDEEIGYIKDGKWGYIDATGKTVIPPQYAEVGSFAGGLAPVRINDALGYIDTSGKLVIPAKFEAASSFSEGLACVLFHGKYGFIDKTGAFVIKPIYNDALDFSDGRAGVNLGANLAETNGALGGKWGFIDAHGKMIVKAEYAYVYSYTEHLAAVYDGKNHKWGFIDPSGEMAIAAKYNHVSAFSDGLAVYSNTDTSGATKTMRCGYIDKNGKVIIHPGTSHCNNFHEGLTAIVLRGKYGYMNKAGEQVIKPAFSSGDDFSQGYAAVCQREKFGYIDTTGEFVIAPVFDVAREFQAVGE